MVAKLRTGLVIFSDLTELDATGPYEVLARAPELAVTTVAKEAGPVRSEFGLTIDAQADFASAPQFDILCVAGGSGVVRAARDAGTIAFLQAQAKQARWVTSVCTGALLLGAAGLLKGYRATTHWLSVDFLPLVGAIPVKERVVTDRNRMTSAGVTAGIDLALALVGVAVSQERAETIALTIEYDPAPEFKSGNPALADPTIVAEVTGARQDLYDERRAFFAGLKLA